MKLRPPTHPRLRAAAKAAVTAVNTPLAKRRGSRAFDDAQRPVRLEIGGTTDRPGWVVTNVSATTRYYLDATERWPFEDGALEYVYADNVIEHITLAQGRAMLSEAFRCLQPGGVVRIVTPDLGVHIDLFRSGEDAVSSPVADSYRALGLRVDHPIDLVRIPIAAFGHHLGYLYDTPTLTAELESVGFVDVERFDPGASNRADLAGLDLRTHEGGAQMAVEAVKPGR